MTDRPDGAFTISEAERLLGMRGGGLHRWLKRHGYFKFGRCPKIGKYRYVTPEILEKYEAQTNRTKADRAASRPAGYVGVYRAAELAGCSVSLIWAEVRRGNLHAVRVGYIQYYNPDDCRRLAQSMSERPLPGYAQVLDYTKPRSADAESLLRWLRVNGGTPRKFRRPQDHQFAWYARQEALDAWAAQYEHGSRGQKLTLDQARDIRARRAAGEKRSALAREYGVSEAAILQIIKGRTYREAPQAAD